MPKPPPVPAAPAWSLFNRGYIGFEQTNRTCTPAAYVAIRLHIEEGLKISRDLTDRYAN
ncbi:putative secreted protein [Bradyrhizobium sp. USDA 3315]